MQLYQLISQPWALPVLVGVAALLLGLLIPRRGGASWLSGIIFFLPNLFLDFLDMVHTKKFKYYGLITALLAIEAFFAFRAATVYYDVLNAHMPGPEMAIVCVIVFVAVFLCGYMVATHGKLTFKSGCTMAFVIFHDWTGTFWMNYSQPATGTTNATIAAPNDPLKLALTIGMCVLGLLPFIMGAWAEELRPQLEKELDEEVDAFTSTATRKIKRRAVERVLRLANHTNIVHLVRALPADEFSEFKQFVMPIIAPGTPYNLDAPNLQPETSQSDVQDDGQDATHLAEKNQSNEQPENHQNDMHDDNQMNDSFVANELPNDTSNEGQNDVQPGRQKTVKTVAKKPLNDTSKSVAKTARRDARIRDFATAHPNFTYAKLATKFRVSVSTISRVLNPQNATPVQPQGNNPADAEPSHNGHHKEQDTGEMETVSISDEEILALARQN